MRVKPVQTTIFMESRLSRMANGAVGTRSHGEAGRNWTRGLLGLPGVQLAVRVSADPDEELQQVEGTIRPLRSYIGLRGLLVALPRLLIQVGQTVRQSGVVVVRLPGPIGTLAGILAILYGRPLAVDLAGDVREVVMAISKSRFRGAMATSTAKITRAIVKRASVVRYVTESTLQAAYPAAPNATTVAFSAVDITDDWLADDASPGHAPQPSILAVGTQEVLYKGHDVLIESFKQVLKQVPNAKLVLIGEGRLQTHLKKMASDADISSCVEFRGHVTSRTALAEALDSAWVFAQPSRTEGLPRALIEAMARGKACVGTRAGGIPELLPQTCLTDIGDANALTTIILHLLQDEPRRREFGTRNLHRAGFYTRGSMDESAKSWRTSIARLQ